ncbi:hypothetical protein EJB05_01358, partial [Eragrostis curvula]
MESRTKVFPSRGGYEAPETDRKDTGTSWTDPTDHMKLTPAGLNWIPAKGKPGLHSNSSASNSTRHPPSDHRGTDGMAQHPYHNAVIRGGRRTKDEMTLCQTP